eukprot:m.76624 g.76624  ORF g.76624 m.76624 type:complete len:2796 (-) comp12569_c0_seq1:1639-10026(-)
MARNIVIAWAVLLLLLLCGVNGKEDCCEIRRGWRIVTKPQSTTIPPQVTTTSMPAPGSVMRCPGDSSGSDGLSVACAKAGLGLGSVYASFDVDSLQALQNPMLGISQELLCAITRAAQNTTTPDERWSIVVAPASEARGYKYGKLLISVGPTTDVSGLFKSVFGASPLEMIQNHFNNDNSVFSSTLGSAISQASELFDDTANNYKDSVLNGLTLEFVTSLLEKVQPIVLPFAFRESSQQNIDVQSCVVNDEEDVFLEGDDNDSLIQTLLDATTTDLSDLLSFDDIELLRRFARGDHSAQDIMETYATDNDLQDDSVYTQTINNKQKREEEEGTSTTPTTTTTTATTVTDTITTTTTMSTSTTSSTAGFPEWCPQSSTAGKIVGALLNFLSSGKVLDEKIPIVFTNKSKHNDSLAYANFDLTFTLQLPAKFTFGIIFKEFGGLTISFGLRSGVGLGSFVYKAGASIQKENFWDTFENFFTHGYGRSFTHGIRGFVNYRNYKNLIKAFFRHVLLGPYIRPAVPIFDITVALKIKDVIGLFDDNIPELRTLFQLSDYVNLGVSLSLDLRNILKSRHAPCFTLCDGLFHETDFSDIFKNEDFKSHIDRMNSDMGYAMDKCVKFMEGNHQKGSAIPKGNGLYPRLFLYDQPSMQHKLDMVFDVKFNFFAAENASVTLCSPGGWSIPLKVAITHYFDEHASKGKFTDGSDAAVEFKKFAYSKCDLTEWPVLGAFGYRFKNMDEAVGRAVKSHVMCKGADKLPCLKGTLKSLSKQLTKAWKKFKSFDNKLKKQKANNITYNDDYVALVMDFYEGVLDDLESERTTLGASNPKPTMLTLAVSLLDETYIVWQRLIAKARTQVPSSVYTQVDTDISLFTVKLQELVQKTNDDIANIRDLSSTTNYEQPTEYTWMLVLNEILSSGIPISAVKAAINKFKRQPNKYTAGLAVDKTHSPDSNTLTLFPHLQPAGLTSLFKFINEAKAQTRSFPKASGTKVRISFPDLKFYSIACLIMDPTVNPGFDGNGDICKSYLYSQMVGAIKDSMATTTVAPSTDTATPGVTTTITTKDEIDFEGLLETVFGVLINIGLADIHVDYRGKQTDNCVSVNQDDDDRRECMAVCADKKQSISKENCEKQQTGKCVCAFSGKKVDDKGAFCGWQIQATPQAVKRFESSLRLKGRCNSGPQRRGFDRVGRQSVNSLLGPIVIALDFGDIREALTFLWDPLPEWLEDALDDMKMLMPDYMSTALVLSSAEVSILDEAVPQDVAALLMLPSSTYLQGGISFVATFGIPNPDDCEEDDAICTFLANNFTDTGGISLILGVQLVNGYGINAQVNIGGLIIANDEHCPAAIRAKMDSVAFFLTVTTKDQKIGLRVAISVDIGDERKQDDPCTDLSMRNPLLFIGELYAGATPAGVEIGGSLVMKGVVYQVFGLEWLHFSDMFMGISFIPPAPVPSSFEAGGTLSLGQSCYKKDEFGKLIDNFNLAGGRSRCVRATLAFGYDAVDTSNNYFFASISKFTLEKLIIIFTEGQFQDDLLRILPQVVLDTGFIGDSYISYANSLSNVVTPVGQVIPGGLHAKGNISFLGYKIFAEVHVVPLVLIHIDARADPLKLPGITLTSVDDENVGPKVYIKAGLGGGPAQIAKLGAALISGANLSDVGFGVDVWIDGAIDILGARVECRLIINSTHFITHVRVPLFLTFLYAEVDVYAAYGNLQDAAFEISGRIVLEDLLQAALTLIADILEAVADLLQLIMTLMEGLEELWAEFQGVIDELIASDSAFVTCIGQGLNGLKSGIDFLLSEMLKWVPGCEQGGCQLSDFFKFISDGVRSVSDLVREIDTGPTISAEAYFTVGANIDLAYFEAGAKLNFFGEEFETSFRVSKEIEEDSLAEHIGNAILEAVIPVAKEFREFGEEIVNSTKNFVNGIEFSCDEVCQDFVKGAFSVFTGIMKFVRGLIEVALEIATFFANAALDFGQWIQDVLQGIENSIAGNDIEFFEGPVLDDIEAGIKKINDGIKADIRKLTNNETDQIEGLKLNVERHMQDLRDGLEWIDRMKDAEMTDIEFEVKNGLLYFKCVIRDGFGDIQTSVFEVDFSLRRKMERAAREATTLSPGAQCTFEAVAEELGGYIMDGLNSAYNAAKEWADSVAKDIEAFFGKVRAEMEEVFGPFPECATDTDCAKIYRGNASKAHCQNVPFEIDFLQCTRKRQTGERCVLGPICEGYTLTGTGSWCCGLDPATKTCQVKQEDYLGAYYCPDACKRNLFASNGTCGDSGEIGKTCSACGDCDNYDCGTGQGTQCCTSGNGKKCENKVLDHSGAYYCKADCVAGVGDPTSVGTCAAVSSGGNCQHDAQCIGFTADATKIGYGCCNGKCELNVRDYTNNYYPQCKCKASAVSNAGTCEVKSVGQGCVYDAECIGFGFGSNSGTSCCAGTCKTKILSGGNYVCPKVSLGGKCLQCSDCNGCSSTGISCCVVSGGLSTCQDLKKDHVGLYQCPAACAVSTGVYNSSCETQSAGSTCTYDAECIGHGKPGFGCCFGQCTNHVFRSGAYQCPLRGAGATCNTCSDCSGCQSSIGIDGMDCCGSGTKTCQNKKKDHAGNYYCADTCTIYALGPTNLCETKSVGSSCSYGAECVGYTPSGYGVTCCQGTCKYKVSISGTYRCPLLSLGSTCSSDSECSGFGHSSEPVECCQSKCTKLVKDHAGVFYCPHECNSGAGLGTCETKALNLPCTYNAQCIDHATGANKIACCNNKCSYRKSNGVCPLRSVGSYCTSTDQCEGHAYGCVQGTFCCSNSCTNKVYESILLGCWSCPA